MWANILHCSVVETPNLTLSNLLQIDVAQLPLDISWTGHYKLN